MKRFLLIILSFSLIAAALSGCSGFERPQAADDKISIIATIFPHYDWLRQIIGDENMDRFDLSFLIGKGIDLHNYSPSVSDMISIKTSDVFIYVGGHSDGWVADVLKSADANPDIIAVNLIDLLGDDILVDYDHDHEECDEEHEEDALVTDEHVWLSLRNAQTVCAAFAELLSELDQDNADSYRDNLAVYVAQLSALDAEYKMVADAASVKTMVFASRFPFRYMVDDYGLSYYAAFSGCSAETEASFVTIISLANRLNQLDLGVVFVTECSDQAIARRVISETDDGNQEIMVLDGLQSITESEAQSGVTYLSIMESNLEVLRRALN